MHMSKALALLLAACLSAVCTHAAPSGGIWPASDSLILFYPLDEITGTRDIVNDKDEQLQNTNKAVVATNNVGPFGLPRTSYTVTNDGQIGEMSDVKLSPSFTVGFYFFTSRLQGTAAILQLASCGCNSCKQLGVTFQDPDLLKISANPYTSPQTLQLPMIAKNTWAFIAISYDDAARNLSVSDVNGRIAGTMLLRVPFFDSDDYSANIAVGRVGTTEMRNSDSIACLTFHKTALNTVEIGQLSEQCKTKGRRSPDGTWPNPESMLGYWPFDNRSVTRNVVNGFPLWTSRNANGLGFAPAISLNSAFTITFNFYSQMKGNGAILWFPVLSPNGPPNGFAVHYLEPNLLEIRGGLNEADHSKAPSYKLIGRFPVLLPNTWNHVVISYDQSSRTLTVSGASVLADIPVNASSMYLGYSSIAYDKELGMKPTDAISQLMLHDKVLTTLNVAQKVYEKLRLKRTERNDYTTLRKSLLALCPLDRESRHQDVLFRKYIMLADATIIKFAEGPFGQPDGAYTLTKDSELGTLSANSAMIRKVPVTEFTFSLYAKLNNGNGAILKFGLSNYFALDFVYEQSAFLAVYQNFKLVGRFPILKPASWNFLAISYDSLSQMMAIFNERGEKLVVAFAEAGKRTQSSPSLEVRLGAASVSSGQSVTMKAGDALACLLISGKLLTPGEISEIPQKYCQNKGRYLGNWPKSESLLAFWPFDGDSETWDLAYNLPSSIWDPGDRPKLVTSLPGPFGFANSSYSARCDAGKIGEQTFDYKPEGTDFTLSFYLYTDAKGHGAIYRFSPVFALTYSPPGNLVIWDEGETDALLGNFTILKPNSWNFVALVYNDLMHQLSAFDEHGMIATIPAEFNSRRSASVSLGGDYWRPAGTKVQWKMSDAMACLMIYNAALSPPQIDELPHVCRTKGEDGTTTAPVPKTTKVAETTTVSETTTAGSEAVHGSKWSMVGSIIACIALTKVM